MYDPSQFIEKSYIDPEAKIYVCKLPTETMVYDPDGKLWTYTEFKVHIAKLREDRLKREAAEASSGA